MKDYRKLREIKTGYYLTSEELAKLTDEEKSARHKIMLDTRDEIRRLEDELNVEVPVEKEDNYYEE
jgi:hypothetical protein